MEYETNSLNTQIISFEETVGLMELRPIEPKHLPRLLKIRQMYVDAGLMQPLEQYPYPMPESPKEESK